MKIRRINISSEEKRLGYAFILPGVFFLGFFIFIPIIYSIYMSLFEWKLFDLGKIKTFVGLDNFIRIFSDKVFVTAILNTLTIVVFCLVIELILGFIISLSLWNIKRSMKVAQSLILLPMITSPVIVGLIWRFIYDPQFGIVNYVLRNTIGVGNIAWLGNADTALISVIIVDVWQMTSFVILILYAGMTSIPNEYLEASLVDGTTYFQTVRYMVIPSISHYIILVLMMRTMDLFKIFDTVYVLTRGGPGYATETLSMYTYKTSFQFYEMGYAMALSLVSLVCILMISISYMKLMKRKD
ncbi:MAG: sugar ABC transporter permease [Clostridiaceae bacterium]|jgi:multiple sugar transport system permease protein|nr:sugar ABC transporter permease [Clostridiaceae bacterium]